MSQRCAIVLGVTPTSRLAVELQRIAEGLSGGDRRLLKDVAEAYASRNCEKCGGLGLRLYSNTSTWRRCAGGQSFTTGVCDHCWGSGSQDEPGLDLRKHEAALRDAELKGELRGFASLCRLFGRQTHDGFDELLRVIEAQHRRRKLPDDVDPFWYGQLVEAFAAQLRRYVDAAKQEQPGALLDGGAR